MAEGNGNHDTRMDRIERALELLIADHEQFRADHKQLLIAQVVQSDEIEKLLKVTQEQTRQLKEENIARKETTAALDTRVNDLVLAIGDLIARIPPQNLIH
jgi:hypothetical protein